MRTTPLYAGSRREGGSDDHGPGVGGPLLHLDRMSSLWDTVRNLAGGGPGATGPPRVPQRASSFHLFWDFPAPSSGRRPTDRRLAEVSATLEVLVPPRAQALYFWALQVDFADTRGIWGGGHTGLQWNRRYPGGTAVNWGGYESAESGGRVLSGTVSSLPGFADDPHTLAFAWRALRAYRFRVYPSPDLGGAWRAEVADLASGAVHVIRDLVPPAGRGSSAGLQPLGGTDSVHLVRPMVWSEVFAPCDAPSVTVRWSDLQAVEEGGAVLRPEAVRVNYQAAGAGGCPNTTVATDGTGVLQITAAGRSAAQGSRLILPGG